MAKINLDIGHALSREDQRRNRRNSIFISQSFPLMSFSGNRAAKFSKKRFYRIRRKRDRPCKQADSSPEDPVRIPAATPCQPRRSLPNAGGTSGRLQHFARTAHRAMATIAASSHCRWPQLISRSNFAVRQNADQIATIYFSAVSS
jgi:hypothetical protein